MQDLPWRNIWSADNPIEALNEHLLLLVGSFIPTKIIRVRNKDKPWFDDQCRHAFGLQQETRLRWTRDRSRVNWEKFVHFQVRANETYSEAKRQFSARNRDVLMNAQSPHKWWSTLKSAVFGLSSSLPPLVGVGDGLVCELVSKADLLSDHFYGKQSRESIDLPLTCHPSPSLTSFAFRSSELRRLLLDLDPYRGSDPKGMFPFFLKRTADVLGVVFRRLVRLGSFPACWRQANVTPIPKGPPSSSVANYRPISITSVLPKVFGRLHGVGSPWTIYGTQWWASNHPVCLSEWSGYLWYTFVRVAYTSKGIGEWAGG